MNTCFAKCTGRMNPQWCHEVWRHLVSSDYMTHMLWPQSHGLSRSSESPKTIKVGIYILLRKSRLVPAVSVLQKWPKLESNKKALWITADISNLRAHCHQTSYWSLPGNTTVNHKVQNWRYVNIYWLWITSESFIMAWKSKRFDNFRLAETVKRLKQCLYSLRP